MLPEFSPQCIQISKMMQRLSHKRVVWVEHRLSDFQGSLQQWSSLEIIQWHIKNSILLLLLHDRSSGCHATISWLSVTQQRRVRHGLHILKIQLWFCNFIIWNLRLSSSYNQKSKKKQAGKARESKSDREVIEFSSASDWLKEWSEFYGPITVRFTAKPTQPWITSDTQFKIALHTYYFTLS